MDSFSRAYGDCIRRAIQNDYERAEDVANEAVCALDGLRVVAQDLGETDLQGLIFDSYHIWEEALVACGGVERSTTPRFSSRFAFSLGLARGLEGPRAVIEAQRALTSPPRQNLLDEMAMAVKNAVLSASDQERVDAESEAARRAGETWAYLPVAVRDQLAQAECMERILWPTSFDWAPVALPYLKAIELLLKGHFGQSLATYLNDLPAFLQRHLRLQVRTTDCSRLTIGQFGLLMEKSVNDPGIKVVMEHTYAKHVGRLRDAAPRLRILNKQFRDAALHAGEPWGGSKVRDLKRLLYDSPVTGGESLVCILSQLRPLDELP